MRVEKFEETNFADYTLQLWYERLGHYDKLDIRELSKKIDRSRFLDEDDECDVCNTQKARCNFICKTVGTRASKPLEAVHAELNS